MQPDCPGCIFYKHVDMTENKFYKYLILVVYASFPETQQVVEIPFYYSDDGHIVTRAVISNDTINFIVDTGSSFTIVNADKGNPANTNYMITNTAFNETNRWPSTKIDEVSWGKVKLKNFTCAQHRTSEKLEIIGGDILRNFCVKIDNSQNKIVLAQKIGELKPKGKCVPFSLKNNTIILKGVIEGKEFEVLFDSGYNAELLGNIYSFSDSNTLNTNKVVWANEIASSVFVKNRYIVHDSLAYVLMDFGIGTLNIANMIVSSSSAVNQNLLGTVFMRRFKSITIDYNTSRIWFELPDDHTLMKFTGKQLHEVPLSYLNILYNRINSFGIQLTDSIPFTIHSLQYNDDNNGLEAGDTLAGIDNMLFNEIALDKISKSDNSRHFYVEKNIAEQKEKVFRTFSQKDKATFHFLKSGSIKSVKIERDKQLFPAPYLAYSFSPIEPSSGFSAINFPEKGMWFHIPWSTLSGKEQTITTYKNGKEQTISNVPQQDD